MKRKYMVSDRMTGNVFIKALFGWQAETMRKHGYVVECLEY